MTEAAGEYDCGELRMQIGVMEQQIGAISGRHEESVTLTASWGDGPEVELLIDSEPAPLHLAASGAAPSMHGTPSESTRPLNIFLPTAALSRNQATGVEACVEEHSEEILGALGSSTFAKLDIDQRPIGDFRAYWPVAPAELVPTFTDGDRTLSLERNGDLRVTYPSSVGPMSGTTSTLVGRVRLDGEAASIDCCEYLIARADLADFTDATGLTLHERFRVK